MNSAILLTLILASGHPTYEEMQQRQAIIEMFTWPEFQILEVEIPAIDDLFDANPRCWWQRWRCEVV